MMPIKIRCGCGQKYAFDVEPVDGAMGYAVACPVCGVDGTVLANELIAERLGVHSLSVPALRLGRQAPVPAADPPVPRHVPGLAAARKSSGAKVRNKKLLPVACGGVVLVLIGAALVGRSVGLGQKPVNAAAAGNDGLPHTPAELNAWYVEPPDGQNAAQFFSEGIQALHLANVESSGVPLLGRGKLPPLGSPMPASVKSSLSALIRSNRESLRFFAQATRYEQSRYPVDLSLGAEAAFPHLTKMIGACQLLELAAISHAEANDAKSSADDLRSALALANSLRAEPYFFSQIVRARLVGIAVAGLEQSANRACWTTEGSAELFNDFQKMEENDARGDGFGRSVIGERVMAMSLLAKPEKFLELLPVLAADISPDRRARMAARLQSGKLQAEERFFDQALLKLLQVRRQPFPDRLKADDLIRQQTAEAESTQLVLAEFLLSGLKIVAAKEARCLACLRLGLTATALDQFRATHDHRYPATLSELTPSPFATIPTDPYDGQPLRYKTKTDGYVLYSVGPDLKDNLGQRTNDKEGNIVFAVIIPPRQRKD